MEDKSRKFRESMKPRYFGDPNDQEEFLLNKELKELDNQKIIANKNAIVAAKNDAVSDNAAAIREAIEEQFDRI